MKIAIQLEGESRLWGSKFKVVSIGLSAVACVGVFFGGIVASPVATAASGRAGAQSCDVTEFKQAVETKIHGDWQALQSEIAPGSVVNGIELTIPDDVALYYDCSLADALHDFEAHKDKHSKFMADHTSGPEVGFRAIGNYQASVWAGVPGIGHGHVRQDFRANVNSGKISTTTFLSNKSRLVGLVLGSWDHNRSWFEKRRSNTCLRVYMKGTMTWGIPNTPLKLSADQTYLATYTAKGGSLVRATYDKC